MDRLQLKECLRAAAVPEERYLLVGVDAPRPVSQGAWIVRPNQRSWEVLVWQPEHPQPSLTFLNELEACEYVLNALVGGLPRQAAGPAAAGQDQGHLTELVR